MDQKSNRWINSLHQANLPDEVESKQFLAGFGIEVPNGIRLNPDSDLAQADRLKPPFCLKVLSPDILHKTEENGVLLNINKEKLGLAVKTMRKRFPGRALLLEEMVEFDGPEFILGAIDDPDYGTAVMAGTGGIMTELYKDAGFRLAPLSVTEAERLLDELITAPVLHGYRGAVMNKRMLAKAITVAGEAALSLGRGFSQLDINPIVFSRKKWIALDVKIILNSV